MDRMTNAAKIAARHAQNVTLAIVPCRVARELYDVYEPALDEEATLRRVALFARGSGRASLTQDERCAALTVIRERFDARFAA